jgi:hypothetical protein
MRTPGKTAWCIVPAILAISACAAFQPVSAGKGAKRMGPTASGSPWQLTLESSGPLKLCLRLRNVSSSAQTFLHDPDLQPSELRILNAAGQPVKGADDRMKSKFDNTVHHNDYRVLKPGTEIVLGEAAFSAANGRYELRWTPFKFHGLAPGKYRVQAIWTSEKSKWSDPDDNKSGVIAGIWLGAVSSNIIEITLP